MLKTIVVVIVCVIAVLILVPILFNLAGNSKTEPPPSDGTPIVVNMVPPNGATNVDPNLSQLVVTFNVPMGGGFSWTGGGPDYPETTSGAFWTPDKKTCTLPVRLKPNWSYRLGLNSPSYKNFRSAAGIPLDPLIWTFSTGG